MRLEAGATIERYVIEELLGEGGMAVVVRARHQSLGSTHAIKVLKDCKPSVAKRVIQEGQLQSKLQHPNVVQVTDLLTIDGAPALVMEHIAGPTLAQLLSQFRPTLQQSDSIARGLMRGVAAAHAQGLVHRDLKPANILMAIQDGVLVPKIADFGLAKLLATPLAGEDSAHLVTQPGLIMGTPAYMAPEQFENSSDVDARADIFSLGAVLYELLTGTQCFKGDSVMEVWRRISQGQYDRVAELAPGTPARMQRAVERSLVTDPNDRAQDVRSLLRCWESDEAGVSVPLADAELRNSWTEILAQLRWSGVTPREHSPEVHATTQGQLQSQLRQAMADASSKESNADKRSLVTQVPARKRWIIAAALLAILGMVGVLMTEDTKPTHEVVSTSAKEGTIETGKRDKLQQKRQILRLIGTLGAKDHRRFVDARKALLAARFEQMHRELGALSDAAVSQPAPQLLSAIAHRFEDLDDQAELAIRGAVRAVQARHDALASLARLAGTHAGHGEDSEHIKGRWKALDAAMNDDPLARLLSLVAHPGRLPRKQLLQHVSEMRSASPKSSIFDLYELQLHRAAGAHKTHLERASELVAASSQHPELALELARGQLRADDVDGAEKTLKPLLKMASLAPRADRIGALIALRRNDEAARMRHLMISLGDARSDHQQHMMVRWHVVDLASHGRLKEALKLVRFCARPSLEGAPDSAERAAACWRAVLPYALSLQATAQSKEVLAGLRKALQLPGVHQHLARRWQAEATAADALLSLRQGNRLPANELVEKLVSSPRRAEPWLTRWRETLQSELALSDATGQAAERQRAMLQQHIDSQAQADVALSCERVWSQLRLAVALGRQTLERSLRKQLIDGACRGAFESWALYRAQAYRHAAELMGERGDLETKQAHLEALERHWPAADIQQL